MPDISNRVLDLMEQLVAEGNKHDQNAITMHGEFQLNVGLRMGEAFVFAIKRGNTLEPVTMLATPHGLHLGKYRLGIFLIPDRSGPMIIETTATPKVD